MAKVYKKSTVDRKKPHEDFAEKIIAMIEKGVAPWQKSWKAGEYHSPLNPVSGTVYRGFNNMVLSAPDYLDPRWMTFKQANEKGFLVKAGSKATPIVYWQWTDEVQREDEQGRPMFDDSGKPVKESVVLDRPRIYFYSVFHAGQLQTQDRQDIPAYEPKELTWNAHDKAEVILQQSGAAIFHDQRDRAAYRPYDDTIHLPPREHFNNAGDYYNTALHELGHWACSKHRLNISAHGSFDSESYAKEELIVEISSWMICRDLGMDFKPEDSASYVASWLKALKNDPYEIVRACAAAEKVKKYILGLDQELNYQPAPEASPLTEAARELPPWYGGLSLPENFRYKNPQLLELPQKAKAQERRNLMASYKHFENLVAESLSAEPDLTMEATSTRRNELAANIMEAYALHRKMIELELIDKTDKFPHAKMAASILGIPEPELGQNIPTPKWTDRLGVYLDTNGVFKPSYPDLAALTVNASDEEKTKLRRQYLFELAGVHNTLQAAEDEKWPVSYSLGNYYTEDIRKFSKRLLDGQMLHNKMLELGMFAKDEEHVYTYQELADSVRQVSVEQFFDLPNKERPSVSEINHSSGALELAELISDSVRKSVEAAPEELAATLAKIKLDLDYAMAAPAFNAKDTRVESLVVKMMARRINQVVRDISEPNMPDAYIAPTKGELATLGHIVANHHGNKNDQDFFKPAIQTFLDSAERNNPNHLFDILTGGNVDFTLPHTPGLEWCQMDLALDFYQYDLYCRGEGEIWREPSSKEKEMLAQSPSNNIPPVIYLDDSHFLTYDGQVRDSKLELIRETSPVENQKMEFVSGSQTPSIDQINPDEFSNLKIMQEGDLKKTLGGVIQEALDNSIPPKALNVLSAPLSPENEFAETLKEAGFILDGPPIMDGKIHRVPVDGGGKGSKDGAYCAYLDGKPNGWMHNHKTGQRTKWIATGHQLSGEQLASLKKDTAARREQISKEREAAYQQAADRSLNKILSSRIEGASPDHPYLKAKGVKSYGLSQDNNGNLLVVGLDMKKSDFLGIRKIPYGQEPPKGAPKSHQELEPRRFVQTLQTISPAGKKSFEPGSRKTGAAFVIGQDLLQKIAFEQHREKMNPQPLLQDLQAKPEILIAEGYATGATLHEATGLPVVVAFDAANLQPVAKVLKEKFPKAELIICADNDHKLKTNVGLEKALEAAIAVDGWMIFPEFTDEEQKCGLTDFNDFAQARGLKAVTQEINCQRLSVLETQNQKADKSKESNSPAAEKSASAKPGDQQILLSSLVR